MLINLIWLFPFQSALQEGKSQEEFEALSDMVYERLQQASIPTGYTYSFTDIF